MPGAPRSRREALAREAATGSTPRAGRVIVPRSRSPLPISGEMPVISEQVQRRGHPITGPLQISAPVQRLRALLADLSASPGSASAGSASAGSASAGSTDAGEEATGSRGCGAGGAGVAGEPGPGRGHWARMVARQYWTRLTRVRQGGAGQPDTGRPGQPDTGLANVDQLAQGRSAGTDRLATEPADADRRRQLVALALGLGGLGLTGWAAVEVTRAVGVPSADTTAGRDRTVAWPTSRSQQAPRSPSPTIVDPALTLGYGEIDHQHQRAAALLSILDEAVRSGSPRRQVLAMSDFVAWVRVHFAFEEALMDSYRLPDMATHKAHHRSFLAQVGAFAVRLEAGAAVLTSEMIGMLRDWMQQHVTRDDMVLVTELNVRGVSSAV